MLAKEHNKNQQDSNFWDAEKGIQHYFDIGFAALYGIIPAILIQHFKFWISLNQYKKINEHDGHTWTYQKLDDIQAHLPEFTVKQIRAGIDKLVDEGVLIKGNYNKSAYDRTVWYAFSIERKFTICPNGHIDNPDRANGFPQKGTPIPDIKPNKRTNKAAAKDLETGEKPADAGAAALSQKDKEWVDEFVAKKKPENEEAYRKWAIKNIEKLRKEAQAETKKSPLPIAMAIKTLVQKNGSQDVEMGPDYIEFRSGIHVKSVKFDDAAFLKVCQEEVKRRSLSWSDVERIVNANPVKEEHRDQWEYSVALAVNYNPVRAPQKGVRLKVSRDKITFKPTESKGDRVEIPFGEEAFKEKVEQAMEAWEL